MVGSLAGSTGGVGSVGGFCQFHSNIDSPREHVGWHHVGMVGCIASAGSAGMRGGATGGAAGCVDAQPVASAAKVSNISVNLCNAGACVMSGLFHGAGRSCFVVAGAAFGKPFGFGLGGTVFGHLGLQAVQAPCQRAGHGAQNDAAQQGRPSHQAGQNMQHQAAISETNARAAWWNPAQVCGCGLPGRHTRM